MGRRPAGSGVTAWLVASGGIALFVLAPIAALIVTASGGSNDLWEQLILYVLPAAVRDTLVLLSGVAVLTVTIGAGTAWLTTAYDFPGRRVVDWALLLEPIANQWDVSHETVAGLPQVGRGRARRRAAGPTTAGVTRP